MKKKIGILGGMGPESTHDLFGYIIRYTNVAKDQDHIPVLIVNDPEIPDRSEFILGKGPSPVDMLIKNAENLEEMGADFLLIPCNTAHYFINQVEEQITIPIIDMIKLSAKHMLKNYPGIKKIGLLSTTGTYKTGIYSNAFNNAGLNIINPDEKRQERIMDAVYGKEGIKAGFRNAPLKILLQSAENLEKKGVDAIITGCTEISLVLKQSHFKIPLIDPLEILAKEAVHLAGYSLPE